MAAAGLRVPWGGAGVAGLVNKAFDSAEKKAQDDWEINLAKQVEASAAELERLGEILDLLSGDLSFVTAQVARMERMPEVATQLVETALATDSRCQEAAKRLETLARRFERLEAQQAKMLLGQEEMLPLLRRTVGVCDFVDELRASGFAPDAFGELLRSFQEALRLLGQGQVTEAESALGRLAAVRPESAAAAVAGRLLHARLAGKVDSSDVVQMGLLAAFEQQAQFRGEDEEAWRALYSDISRPFAKPSTGRIAVKVINHFGDEVLKVFGV